MKKHKYSIVLYSSIVLIILIFGFLLRKRNIHIHNEELVLKKEKIIHRIDSIRSCKYVYIDMSGVMHLDENCIDLFLSDLNTENGHKKGLKRIEKVIIPDTLFNRCCKDCINDKEYEILKKSNNHHER